MWYLYILHSPGSQLYYVGISQKPHERLIAHNTSDRNTFTTKHRPWEMVGLFACGSTESEALSIEKFIKRQKSKAFIQKIIEPGFQLTGILAQLVIPHLAGRTCGINQRVVPQVRDPAGGAQRSATCRLFYSPEIPV